MKTALLIDAAPLVSDRVQPFDGERPYIATGGLDDDGNLSPEMVTYENRPSRADITILPGDICMARMQGTVKVFLLGPTHSNLILSTGFAIFRPIHDQLDSRYLYHYLRTKHIQNAKDSMCTGATQKAITNEKISTLEIPIPPLVEQRRIAEILDRAEVLRVKRSAALAQLDNLTQSIFYDIFGDLRSMDLVPLESLASKKQYALSSGPFGSSLTSKHYVNEGTLVLRGLNVTGGDINLHDCKFVSESKAQELARSAIAPGDIVIVAVGSSGFACLVPIGFPPAIMSQNFNKITPNICVVDPTYLCFALNNKFVQRQFSQNITDTVRTFLSLTKVKKVLVPLPPLPLQYEFARRVAAVERLKTAHRTSLEKWDELFASLQYRAFREEL
ncbi:restriction endonuclease subunit S [Chloroflexota bacterium]